MHLFVLSYNNALISLLFSYCTSHSLTLTSHNLTLTVTVAVYSVLFLVGGVLAGVAALSSLVLLYELLDSWNPNGTFQGKIHLKLYTVYDKT